MQFLPEMRGSGEESRFVIEHNGQEMELYRRPYKTFKIHQDVIVDINNYWARLPEETQCAIFQKYLDIEETIIQVSNPHRLNEYLRDHVKDLFELHDHERVLRYVRQHSRIVFPIQTDDELDRSYPEQLTYSRKDYEDLAAYTILLKAFLPVVSLFMNSIGDEYDIENRFHMAVKLLQRSNMLEHPAYRRIIRYTSHFFKAVQDNMAGSALISGLSSEEAPSWLATYVIYKVLITSPLNQRDGQQNKDAVVGLYHIVKTFSDDLSQHFKDRVNQKQFQQGGTGSDEDKTSYAEHYKTKQDISEGDLVSHEYYAHQGFVIGQRLYPEIDGRLYRECRDNLDKKEMDMTEFQRVICQWVLSPVVSPQSMFYIDYPAMMNMLAITQTCLIQWGFDDVAILLSSQSVISQQASYTTNRTLMSNEQIAELDKICPYHTPQTNVKHNTKKRLNKIAQDIDHLTDDFGSTFWKLALPDTLLERVKSEYENGQTIPFPSTMEFELARLAIHLGNVIYKQPHLTEKKGVVNEK